MGRMNSAKSKLRTRRALCGICSAGCGVVVTYDADGRIALVGPDESSELGHHLQAGRAVA